MLPFMSIYQQYFPNKRAKLLKITEKCSFLVHWKTRQDRFTSVWSEDGGTIRNCNSTEWQLFTINFAQAHSWFSATSLAASLHFHQFCYTFLRNFKKWEVLQEIIAATMSLRKNRADSREMSKMLKKDDFKLYHAKTINIVTYFFVEAAYWKPNKVGT